MSGSPLLEIWNTHVPVPTQAKRAPVTVHEVPSLSQAAPLLSLYSSRFQALAEETSSLVVRWLPDGTEVYANPAFQKYCGRSSNGAPGQAPSANPSRQLWDRVQPLLLKIRPQSPTRVLECPLETRHVRWSVRGLFGPGGQLVEILATGADSSERHAMAAALEQLSTGLLTFRGTGAFAQLAEHLANMVGADYTVLGELVPGTKDRIRTLAGLEGLTPMPPFEYDLTDSPCDPAMRDGISVCQQDVRTTFPRCPWLQGTAAQSYIGVSMKDREGSLLGVALIMYRQPLSSIRMEQSVLRLCASLAASELLHQRDMKARKDLEAQLRQAQKMEAMGRLAGGVAHDFNNLLTVLFGRLDVLAQSQHTPEDLSSLDEIRGVTERAAALTRQLLAFSRNQVMQFLPVNVNEITDNLSRMLRRLLDDDVRLDIQLEPDLPLVDADRGMLEQVILNLVLNARDAINGAGRILLTTNRDSAPGGGIILRVADTGGGISKEHMDRIFEPFFTTKEEGRGSGLGLAMVFGIVNQHHGTIRVASKVGRGTTFTVQLPPSAMPVAPTRPVVKSEIPALRRGNGETILLVEDEHAVRKLAGQLLRACGYQVIEAANGRVALQISDEDLHRVDLLFTDLAMPNGVSGRELADLLLERHPSLKVIYSSGYDPGNIEGGLPDRPGLRFLQKPYPAELLARTVRQTLDEVQPVEIAVA